MEEGIWRRTRRIAWLWPMACSCTIVIGVVRRGGGAVPPLLLLHGLASAARIWDLRRAAAGAGNGVSSPLISAGMMAQRHARRWL